MVSWGDPNRMPSWKFYYGNKNDTAWNRDFNWKNRCVAEAKMLAQRKLEATMKFDPKATGSTGNLNIQGFVPKKTSKMKLGLTGALVPQEDVLSGTPPRSRYIHYITS